MAAERINDNVKDQGNNIIELISSVLKKRFCEGKKWNLKEEEVGRR